MELIKKFQYSLLLFVLAIMIFSVGVVPTVGKLWHRYVVAPEDYVGVTGVITSISEENIAVNFISREVTVAFPVISEDTVEMMEAVLDSYANYMEEGMELYIIYYQPDPEIITQAWNQIRDFFLYGAFTVLGVLVGMLMTKPASPEIIVRPRRSLRERLEKY